MEHQATNEKTCRHEDVLQKSKSRQGITNKRRRNDIRNVSRIQPETKILGVSEVTLRLRDFREDKPETHCVSPTRRQRKNSTAIAEPERLPCEKVVESKRFKQFAGEKRGRLMVEDIRLKKSLNGSLWADKHRSSNGKFHIWRCPYWSTIVMDVCWTWIEKDKSSRAVRTVVDLKIECVLTKEATIENMFKPFSLVDQWFP